MKLTVLILFVLVFSSEAVRRMRFRKARRSGEMLNPQQPNHKIAKTTQPKQQINAPVVEVCLPVQCNTGSALDTDCDFSDSYNVACVSVQEKKCTPISTEKACKKTKKNVIYVNVDKNHALKNGYDIKTYKDKLCTKPLTAPITTVDCEKNNKLTNKVSCEKEGMSISGICKCKNCGLDNKPVKKAVIYEYNVWLWFAILTIVAAVAYFIVKRK